MTYHSGEIAVQTRAGVREELAHLGLIGNTLKPAAEAFLTKQSYLAIAGTVDAEEKIWASLLVGDPGFIQVLSPQIVKIHSLPVASDPLYQNLLAHPQIGILAIDLVNRRRLRLNGEAELQLNDALVDAVRTGAITVQLQETFFNCPKYIQKRYLTATKPESTKAPEIFTRTAFNQSDRQWIASADTFFIASFYPKTGVDASHRGGFPGLVRVLNSNKLVFPDYAGNNMFQTLGNLNVNPRTGLLFVDFEQGHTLQLTGTTTVIWEQTQFAQIPGAQRLIEFTVEQVLETRNATPLRWQFGEYSPAIPA
jgi:uncharacterized protein